MQNYKITYEILNYDKYQTRLKRMLENPGNLFPITKQENLGETKCGFPIEHYTIGNGPKHIIYMAGTHGNEIIGVDYITQLMENIALGMGSYIDFNINEYTLDFIPCQNPEGFFTTTYALHSILNDKTEEEIEKFCKDYYLAYREDDQNAINVNKILRELIIKLELKGNEKDVINEFWVQNREKEINEETIYNFFTKFLVDGKENLKLFIENKWQELFKDTKSIPSYKKHLKCFEGVSLSCIPDKDEKHRKLKEALEKLYGTDIFPIETLATFFANSEGINLNDNNEFYYNELKNRRKYCQNIVGNLRDNNLIKSEPGPIGAPNKSLEEPFQYTKENKCVLDFLKRLSEKDRFYTFFNIHSTGGLLYIYPVFESDLEKAHKEGVERDFTFFINNRLGTEYTKKIGKYYEDVTGIYSPYNLTSHPDRITGIGDYFRKEYSAAFLLELSKMGGNPIGPYGDKEGNLKHTMISNMEANYKLLETILTISYLYDSAYKMSYNEKGIVQYQEIPNKRH